MSLSASREMIGAIDAVCSVAERIIGKLKEGIVPGGPPLLGAAVGNDPGTFPPTPAMKRFADSLARQKGIKPPPGYKTSISICRKFLNEHAPKKADGEATGKNEPKPVSPAQLLYAKKIAQGKGLIIPDEAKTNSATMSAWMNSNRSADRRKRGRKTAYKPASSVAPQSTATTKEVAETQTGCICCRSTGSRAAKFGYGYAATDSLMVTRWSALKLGCPHYRAQVDGMSHLE